MKDMKNKNCCAGDCCTSDACCSCEKEEGKKGCAVGKDETECRKRCGGMTHKPCCGSKKPMEKRPEHDYSKRPMKKDEEE